MTLTHKWTDEDKAVIARMLLDKQTTRQIGEFFDVGRNSVIGLVHRDPDLSKIGLSNKRTKRARKPRSPRKLAPKKPAKRTIKATKNSHPWKIPNFIMRTEARKLNSKPVATKPTTFECRTIPLMALRIGDCKWPVNEAKRGELHLFCGNPAERDRPYCLGHSMLNYRLRPALDRSPQSGDGAA